MRYKLTVEQELKFRKILGFTPSYFAIPSLELMLNVNPTNETEKYMKENIPFEYLRYLSNNVLHSELNVGDYAMTLRGGFGANSGGSVLKVYNITPSGIIYLCTLSCKDPFNEKECESGDRFCITKDEAFDKVLYLRNFDIYYKRYLKRYKTV